MQYFLSSVLVKGRSPVIYCKAMYRLVLLIYSYIFFSVLTELGRSSQAFAELAGRTEGMMTDVVMALIEMGELPNLIHVVCFYITGIS